MKKCDEYWVVFKCLPIVIFPQDHCTRYILLIPSSRRVSISINIMFVINNFGHNIKFFSKNIVY